MKYWPLCIACCVLLAQLWACSEESGSSHSGNLPAVRNVPDPAMERTDAVETRPTTATPVPPSEPDTFSVDLENERVFMPGKGWLGAAEFWDMYYNRPQELPGDLDHGALQALRSKGQDNVSPVHQGSQ